MSRRPHLRLALVLCLLTSATAFADGFSKWQEFHPATQAELAMKSLPLAPGAAAAILDWGRVDDDMYASSSEYYRIKIFTEEGRKYGDVEIPYQPGYPMFARITDFSARTIRPDGSIVPFNGTVYDKVLIKGGGRILRAKTFSFPDVQPGSILEYRYMQRRNETVLFDTLWTLQRDIPIAHAKLALKPYSPKLTSEFSTFFVYVGLPPGRNIEKKSENYELELENLPPVPHEPFSPPEEVMTAHVRFYYTRGTTEPELFWKAETATQRKKIEGFIGGSGTGQALARSLAAETPLATLKNIYAHVQSMRNFSFEVDRTKQEVKREDITESSNAAQVLQRKAGFRDELNRAFVAIARGAGLQAYVVRVAPRDSAIFARQVPDAGQISAEITLAVIDGKPLYLDPGTPFAPFGTVSWEKTTVPGFQVSKQDVKWIEVPQPGSADALTKRVASLHVEGDALEGTVSVTFSGQEALTHRLRMMGDDAAAQKKAIEDEVKEWFPSGAAVKMKQISGVASSEDSLTVSFDVSLPVVSHAGSRVIVPLSVFASAANPFTATQRTNPIYFPHSYSVEDEVTLAIPAGMTLGAVPPPVKRNAGSLVYSNEVKQNGSEVTYRSSLTVDALLIEQKYYGALRNFFSSVNAAEQQPLVLNKGAGQ